VGGAVLTDPDGIVGEDIDHRLLHQGSEPDRRAHIVGEDQKGRAVGTDAAVQTHPIEDGAHSVFTNPETHIPLAQISGHEITAGSDHGLG